MQSDYNSGILPPPDDLMGFAMWEYVHGRRRDIVTWTSLTPPEIFRTAYLFRSYDEMPLHEQKALQSARGRILDIGAGSGVHSLWLQQRGKDVTALERSPYAVKTMQKRGVKHIIHQDFFRFHPSRPYDTVLLLMNGAGIMGSLQNAPSFFRRLHDITAPRGKILVHMSDISYVYYAYNRPLPLNRYYGEVIFYWKYGQVCGNPFPWIYFDRYTFAREAARFGFIARLMHEDGGGDVLVEMMKK